MYVFVQVASVMVLLNERNRMESRFKCCLRSLLRTGRALLATLALAEALPTLFGRWRLVGPTGLRDIVAKARVAMKDDRLGLRLEEPPLPRVLGTERRPADLLEQQEAPVGERRRGRVLAEDLGAGGVLAQ